MKKLFYSVLLVSILFSSAFNQVIPLLGQDDFITLEEVGEAVISAFQSIKVAERNAGDIQELVDKLNEACNLLDQAKIALDNGDLESTAFKAKSCIRISNEVKELAQTAAELGGRAKLWRTIKSTGFNIIFVLSLSIISWQLFKVQYYRNRSSMKSEVVSDEP